MSSSADDKRTRALELKLVFCETAFLQQPPQQPHQSQETLDLLLGLLTYIAWGWDHVLSRRNLSRLMVVAISLVGEMSLDKAVPEPARTIGLLEPKGFEGWYGDASTTDSQLCLERQRAVLGCFVLGSAVSTQFSPIDVPQWTPRWKRHLLPSAAEVAAQNVRPMQP